MDIKIFNQTPSGRIAGADISDLLPRLRAAGTTEAEVISRLADGLLLQTRFGRIRTSDRLHFQPGDRLELRASGDVDRPQLKARDVTPRPLVIDSVSNPRLAEILPANRGVLARVAAIVAETTLIRIAGQLLSLPARLDQPRGQYVSLLRKPEQRIIEVEPVVRKQLYLALLRQLLPRQAEFRPASLAQLYRLAAEVAQAAGGQPSAATAKAKPADSPGAARTQGFARPLATRTSAQQIPLATMDAAARAAPAPKAARGASIQAPTQGGRPALVTRPGDPVTQVAARPNGAVAWSPRIAARVPLAARILADAASLRVTPGNAGIKTAPAADRQAPGTVRHAAPGILPAAPSSGRNATRTARAAGASPSLPPGAESQPATQPPAVASASGTAGSIAAQALPAALQQLLHALPSLQQLDAPTLRRWFEDLGFVRPAPGKSAPAPGGGLLRLLQTINQSDTLARELSQLADPAGKARGEKEHPGAKPRLQEALPSWLRDGIKLIEQALSHNLLQRAALGLQQETQQPATLSFALPVLDEQQVRPLQIELAQKRTASEESAGAWEVRISFDFSGLGPVSCHITLDGSAVAASFYCAQGRTRDRVEQAFPQLRRQLDLAGFSVGELQGFVAAAKPADGGAAVRIDDALIDVEA